MTSSSADALTFSLAGRPVQRVGFGAMQLPGRGVFGPPRDRDAALAVLRRAAELGVNHVDTAQFYGPDVSNELIREALHPYADDLVLVSKVGARRDEQGGWLPAARPEELKQGVRDNLRSLEVDRMGAVNLRLMDEGHGDPADAVPFDEQLGAMVEVRDEGLIGGIGLSNVTLELLERGLEQTEIACVQNAFNLRQRESEPILEFCAERGVAFVPFFPVGSGFAQRNAVLEAPAVREAAQRLEASPAQVALAWLLERGPHVLLIPGTSSVEHLEENLRAGEVTLDEDARAALEGLNDEA